MYKSFLMIIFVANMMYTTHLNAAVIASGNDCGDTCHWEIDDTGKLSVSGSGSLYDYSSNAPWYENRNSVTSLEISEGISSITKHAFTEFSNLLSVSMAASVTRIMDGAFENTNSLTTLTIGNGVTRIGSGVIEGTDNLTTLVIPESVTTIDSYAFQGSNLKNLVIGDGVTSIGAYAFHGIPSGIKIYCQDISENRCHDLINANNSKALSNLVLYTKDPLTGQIKVGKKSYASLADLAKGNNIKKRIYTLEEAQARVKEIGKDHVTFRIRYK